MSGYGGIYSSAHDLVRFAMFHLKDRPPDQEAIIDDAAIDEMQHPTTDRGRTGDLSLGYGIGWNTIQWDGGLRLVGHGGAWTHTSTQVALLPDEDIAVVLLTNTRSNQVERVLSDILEALLPGELNAPNVATAIEPLSEVDPELVGAWTGFIFTPRGEMPIVLRITESALMQVQLAGQIHADLSSVSYANDFPLTQSAGGGPFLRGWINGSVWFEDVTGTKPLQLLLELKLRDGVLGGTLTAEYGTEDRWRSTLAHWVELRPADS